MAAKKKVEAAGVEVTVEAAPAGKSETLVQAEEQSKEATGDRRTWPGSDEVLPLEPYLKLSAEDLEKAVSEKADNLLSESQVAGILILERSGPNRTDQVKVLCKRLKVKSPLEVTKAGPAHTNDATPVTKL
jgi:hypothetical protein